MADTARSLSALQTLLADNSAGDISAQDVRDFLVSTYRPQIHQGFRLTLETGVPVSTTDQLAKGTLYLTPFKHNVIGLYDGTSWTALTTAELSLALTVTSGKNYDVVAYISAGAVTFDLMPAWTNDTTRADGVAMQDGVLANSGSVTTVINSTVLAAGLGRVVGTIRASAANKTADSGGNAGTSATGGTRFVWNRDNQVVRNLKVIDTTDNWNYTTGTWRQANGAAGNKVEYITGDASEIIEARVIHSLFLHDTSGRIGATGVGVNSTSAPTGFRQGAYNAATAGMYVAINGAYSGAPGLGYNYLAWLEYGGDGTQTWIGDNAADGQQTGLTAMLLG